MTHRPRGKSLIEMLIIIGVLSVVLGTTATTLVALFKTDRQVRRDTLQLTTLARLSDRFRTDAHAAASCQVDQGCTFTLAGGRSVRYEHEGQKLHRRVLHGEADEHRDAFVLADTAVVAFHQPLEQGGKLVRLTIRAQADADKAFLTPVRPATIDAAIGLAATDKEAQP
jgi:type II secretory pathway component PulJ